MVCRKERNNDYILNSVFFLNQQYLEKYWAHDVIWTHNPPNFNLINLQFYVN